MNKHNQAGMASIIVVSVLVIILTLISLGFARLMNRAQSNSLNNQLGTAAYYAARSGINDAHAYLTQEPDVVADSCDVLLGSGKPLQDESDALANASGDSARYTCILIDQSPEELSYQRIPAYKSQVVKVTPASGNLANLLLSWQSSDSANSGLPAPAGRLFSESTWASQKNEPLLRVTIYPVHDDGENLGAIETRARTFFLYPSNGGNQILDYDSDPDGSLKTTLCIGDPPATFSGAQVHHCSIDITDLDDVCGAPNCDYYYLRLTPFYGQADIKIKAKSDANTDITFTGAQAVVDVTAKVNTAARRLAARIDISSGHVNLSPEDNALPENAIRSAAALCKRLNTSILNIEVDPSASAAFCNLTL